MFYNIPDDNKNYVVRRNPGKAVKLKIYVLQLLIMYKSHNMMSLLRDMKLVSRDTVFLLCDKSVDLTGVLSCRATMFECLRHKSTQPTTSYCDVMSQA